MALVCIIIALLIERSRTNLHHLRAFHWFDAYSRWMMRSLPGIDKQGAASILILLLPVLVIAGLVQVLLHGHFYDLLSLGFGLIMLIYCLGNNLDADIKQYLHARDAGLDILAQQHAAQLTGNPASEEPGKQITEVMHGMLHQGNMRIFAVIFWFVLLGPVGALLYRLASYTLLYTSSQTLGRAARQLEALLSWAPVNLLAATFALAGDYENVNRAWKNRPRQQDLASCNYHSLIEAGLGAVRCEDEHPTACIRSLRGLIIRSLIIWLAVIAAFTLIGWIN